MAGSLYKYTFGMARGSVKLLPDTGGRYRARYDGEDLGSYPSAQHAADDVAGGHTFTPSDGTDFEAEGVPNDLGEWEMSVYADLLHLRPS